MPFNFNAKSVVLLVFFGHILFFAVLLLVKSIRQQSRSDRWLSGLLFLSALYIAPFMLGYAGWYAGGVYREILFYVPFQQLFLFPVVLFWYVRSLMDPGYLFHRRDWLHFIPALCYALYSLTAFVVDNVVLNEAYFYADGRDKDFDPWYQVSGFSMLVIYLVASLFIYRKYRRKAFDTLSFAESVIHRWAERFLFIFLALLALRLLYFVINPEWAQFGRKFWYYLSFSILIYYISIQGLVSSAGSNAFFITLPSGGAPFAMTGDLAETTAENPGVVPGGSRKEETLMPDLHLWKQKLEDLFVRDRVYEDPLLTINGLASRLNLPSKKLSQVINQGFDMNFNDLVNRYRVQAVIKKIEAGEESLQTILGMALDCGFNSKSTFNRAFKKHTGLTPKEFIHQKNAGK